MAMFRHFPWATIELWPDDLHKNGISTSVILSEHDEIVPSREVETLFADYNAQKEQEKQKTKNGGTAADWADVFLATGKPDDASTTSASTFVKAEVCEGAVHGTVIFDDEVRAHAVSTIHNMIRLNTSSSYRAKNKHERGVFSFDNSGFNNLTPAAFWPSWGDSAGVASASSVEMM